MMELSYYNEDTAKCLSKETEKRKCLICKEIKAMDLMINEIEKLKKRVGIKLLQWWHCKMSLERETEKRKWWFDRQIKAMDLMINEIENLKKYDGVMLLQ